MTGRRGSPTAPSALCLRIFPRLVASTATPLQLRFRRRHPARMSGATMLERLCPACGTNKTRPAARKTLSDDLLSALTIYPFRCQLCARRFLTFVGRRVANPRRSFDRVAVTFPVWFKPRSASPLQLGQEGVIENLSIRGCRIRCQASLSTGMRLELEFQHSNSSFPITIDEAVVRSSVDNRVGLRFVRLHRRDEQRIRQIVDVWLPEATQSV